MSLIKSQIEKARTAVFNVQREIRSIQAQIQEVTDAPCSPEEITVRVSALIESEAMKLASPLEGMAKALASGNPLNELTNALQVTGTGDLRLIGDSNGRVQGIQSNLLPVLAYLFPDMIKERLTSMAVGYAQRAGGLSAEGRRDKLTKLNQALIKLEGQEEELITAAEEMDVWIDRRPDCRPELVLGLVG